MSLDEKGQFLCDQRLQLKDGEGTGNEYLLHGVSLKLPAEEGHHEGVKSISCIDDE
jgi:hypothetical protein